MFEERCEYAKYPNEMPALLLPYPDFSLGRGKMVEVMGKGAVGLCMKKMKAKVGDSPDAGEKKNLEANDSDFAGDFGGFQASKRSNYSVTDNYIDIPPKIVSLPSDLFLGAAPPKVEKGCSKGRQKKLCAKVEKREETQQIGLAEKTMQ